MWYSYLFHGKYMFCWKIKRNEIISLHTFLLLIFFINNNCNVSGENASEHQKADFRFSIDFKDGKASSLK